MYLKILLQEELNMDNIVKEILNTKLTKDFIRKGISVNNIAEKMEYALSELQDEIVKERLEEKERKAKENLRKSMRNETAKALIDYLCSLDLLPPLKDKTEVEEKRKKLCDFFEQQEKELFYIFDKTPVSPEDVVEEAINKFILHDKKESAPENEPNQIPPLSSEEGWKIYYDKDKNIDKLNEFNSPLTHSSGKIFINPVDPEVLKESQKKETKKHAATQNTKPKVSPHSLSEIADALLDIAPKVTLESIKKVDLNKMFEDIFSELPR